MMGSLSVWHWLVVLGVLALLFGQGLFAQLTGDLARGITSFRRGLRDGDRAIQDAKTQVRDDTPPT